MRRAPPLWNTFKEQFESRLLPLLPIHENVVRCLTEPDSPNTLIYGVPGFPHDLLWKQALSRRHGNLVRESCIYEKELEYERTPHSIEIDLAHPKFPRDASILVDFVKSVVATPSISGDRHLFVLRRLEVLRDLQPFRILFEQFSKTAVFWCTTTRLSAIDIPIRSRFLNLRVPLPTLEENARILAAIGADRAPLSRNLLAEIAGIAPSAPDLPDTCEALRERAYKCGAPFARVALANIPGGAAAAAAYLQEVAQAEVNLIATNRAREVLHVEHLLHVAKKYSPQE